jgi:hypothetical protein
MANRRTRWIPYLLAMCISTQAMAAQATGTMIATEQVAATQGIVSASAQRDHVNATLDRADVAAALAERGVSVDQARARVAALTDDEVAQVAHAIDTAPAGASDVLGVIVFVFVLLLITDILGLTKVFPFTRPVR